MRSTERNGLPGDGATPASVLGRAVALVRAFDEDHPVLGVSELARRTGLPKSTVHRLAHELVDERVLDVADGRFRLGMWLFELGEMVPLHRTLTEAATPIMEDLRSVTSHRVHLAILDGIEVVYVKVLGTGRIDVPISSRTGGRLPAHATGVGKVILAYSPVAAVRARIEAGLPRQTPRTICTPGGLMNELRKIRTNGMALDLEESHLGVSCVAAPVFGSDHKIRAGLSVTGPTRYFDPGTTGPAVRTAAFTLSRALRTSGL